MEGEQLTPPAETTPEVSPDPVMAMLTDIMGVLTNLQAAVEAQKPVEPAAEPAAEEAAPAEEELLEDPPAEEAPATESVEELDALLQED